MAYIVGVLFASATIYMFWRRIRPRLSPPVSGSTGTPSDATSKEWADNFEAASERMDHERPDPP